MPTPFHSANLFSIDAGSPRVVPARVAWADDITGALQSCFSLADVSMTMCWCGIPVELGYKYDLSILSEDIVLMVLALARRDDGEDVIHWPSNTFRVDWWLQWSDGLLRVRSKWSVVRGDVDRLNAHPEIELPVVEFLRAWCRPLEILAAGLDAAGYDPAAIRGMPDLHRAVTILRALPRSVELPDQGQ